MNMEAKGFPEKIEMSYGWKTQVLLYFISNMSLEMPHYKEGKSCLEGAFTKLDNSPKFRK
jgi:hypothetical protein